MLGTRRGLRTGVRATAVVTGLGLLAPVTAAAWEPDFEAPFGCRQQWEASTRSGHSPSWYSIDFNRDDDYRAPVLMTAPGVVTDVVDVGNTSYGKYVVVDNGKGWSSLYAHLDVQFVVEGQWLDQGSYVGLLGTSGGSTGPHLHFEERLNRVNQHAKFHGSPIQYDSTIKSRNCGAVPVTGDWNGDQRTDLGIWRPTREGGKFRLRRPNGRVATIPFGTTLDRPVTGDWDGDGGTDVGVWKRQQRVFQLRVGPHETRTVRFGARRDVPITGDWDGDGRTDVGAYRPRKGTVRMREPGGEVTRVRFGRAGWSPVTGDWDGDGRSDLGAFDVRNGTWHVRSSRTGRVRTDTFGSVGSLPAPGDWNSDGTTSLGTWGPTTAAFVMQRGNSTQRVVFGAQRR